MELADGYTTGRTIFGQELVVARAAFEEPAAYRRSGGCDHGLAAEDAERAGVARFTEEPSA